ncbi:MAG: four helix bundle protein [Flavobacteriales bacterium]|nr:four helix bundle protein [Flavobacteriales bacterium]
MEERIYDLEERLAVFAARVVIYVNRMPRSPAGRYYADQLLRSGGSPAMHYGESQGAESDKDFVHKCGIALKELKESKVNLRIQFLACLMPQTDQDLLWLTQECGELVRIVGKVIANKKRRQGG